MGKIAVVYWSGQETQRRWQTLFWKERGKRARMRRLYTPDSFDASMIEEQDAIAFGCPSMGCEELRIQNLSLCFHPAVKKLGGKKVALFGSYGWGDGEWMRDWEETCREAGAVLVCESVICK